MNVHSEDRCYSHHAESGIACRGGEKMASDHRLSFYQRPPSIIPPPAFRQRRAFGSQRRGRTLDRRRRSIENESSATQRASIDLFTGETLESRPRRSFAATFLRERLKRDRLLPINELIASIASNERTNILPTHRPTPSALNHRSHPLI